MEKWSEKVRRYRDRSEELRVIASAVRNPAARKTYLDSADEYDAMAAFAEKAAANFENYSPPTAR